MNNKTKLLSLLLAVAFILPLNAQTEAQLEADTIMLGDQTTLSGHFEQVAGDGIVVLSIADDTTTGLRQAVITSFAAGEHFVHFGPTDSLPLVVADVEVDTVNAELRDIAPLQRVPYTFWEIFRWVLLGLGIAAIMAGILWLWPRLKRHHGETAADLHPIDLRPANQRALENLEALRRKGLWQSGQTKQYYTELTDILRLFIEETLGISATELTSSETCEAITDGLWSEDHGTWRPSTNERREESHRLEDIFTTADLVKFAKGEPQAYEHEHAMAEANTFVEHVWLWYLAAEQQASAAQQDIRKEADDA